MKKVLPPHCALVPDHAEKAFSGQIFDVYHWRQQLFDGSDATFEMLKRPDTMQIIAIRDDKIILINDEQPGRSKLLSLPGGRPEITDPSWTISAQRELEEETGFVFKNWKLIDVRQPVRKIEWFVALYITTGYLSQKEQKLDAGEKIDVLEMDFDSFKKAVFDDANPKISYLSEIIKNIHTLEELITLPEFVGKQIERD